MAFLFIHWHYLHCIVCLVRLPKKFLLQPRHRPAFECLVVAKYLLYHARRTTTHSFGRRQRIHHQAKEVPIIYSFRDSDIRSAGRAAAAQEGRRGDELTEEEEKNGTNRAHSSAGGYFIIITKPPTNNHTNCSYPTCNCSKSHCSVWGGGGGGGRPNVQNGRANLNTICSSSNERNTKW